MAREWFVLSYERQMAHTRTHALSQSLTSAAGTRAAREGAREQERERAAQAQRPIQTTAEILALSAILAALCYLRAIIPQRNDTPIHAPHCSGHRIESNSLLPVLASTGVPEWRWWECFVLRT